MRSVPCFAERLRSGARRFTTCFFSSPETVVGLLLVTTAFGRVVIACAGLRAVVGRPLTPAAGVGAVVRLPVAKATGRKAAVRSPFAEATGLRAVVRLPFAEATGLELLGCACVSCGAVAIARDATTGMEDGRACVVAFSGAAVRTTGEVWAVNGALGSEALTLRGDGLCKATLVVAWAT